MCANRQATLMEKFLDTPNLDVYFVIGILFLFTTLEVVGGYWHSSKRKKEDWYIEMSSFLLLSMLTKPFIVFSVFFIGSTFISSAQYVLQGSNFWMLFVQYILVDDFLQYWYHRSAHETPFLWKLHRAHHQAEEMGFLVSYRNAVLYYLLMPNIWWIGIFTFLGGAKAVILGLIAKQLVVISSHSTVQYDKFLYRYSFLNPLATLIERIFVTPAFHHSHHGKSKLDGVSDPNGNYGNMFSIWDQLFGTATFTRDFPAEYGLVVTTKDSWQSTILYPIITSTDSESEVSKNHQRQKTVLNESSVQLEKGQKYLWCSCGFSQSQPFCDGSHQGTKHKPLLFEAQRTGKAKLCACKKSKNAPFCDNSHLEA